MQSPPGTQSLFQLHCKHTWLGLGPSTVSKTCLDGNAGESKSPREPLKQFHSVSQRMIHGMLSFGSGFSSCLSPTHSNKVFFFSAVFWLRFLPPSCQFVSHQFAFRSLSQGYSQEAQLKTRPKQILAWPDSFSRICMNFLWPGTYSMHP